MSETASADGTTCPTVDRRRAAEFDAAIQSLRPRLFAFIRRLAPADASIEDITQEVLARALERLPSRRKRGRLAAWIFGVAVNVCHEARRSHSSREVPVDDGVLLEIPDVGLDLASLVQRREERRALECALGRLNDTHREVLLLRDSAGLTYRQIAETLGIPVGTVRSRIHNATARLLQIVQEELG